MTYPRSLIGVSKGCVALCICCQNVTRPLYGAGAVHVETDVVDGEGHILTHRCSSRDGCGGRCGSGCGHHFSGRNSG